MGRKKIGIKNRKNAMASLPEEGKKKKLSCFKVEKLKKEEKRRKGRVTGVEDTSERRQQGRYKVKREDWGRRDKEIGKRGFDKGGIPKGSKETKKV